MTVRALVSRRTSCSVVVVGLLLLSLQALARDYKISVPITNGNLDEFGGGERIVGELHKMNAERVLLANGVYCTDPEKRRIMFSNLKKNAAFFKKAGFEVGTWNWSFLHDGGDDFFVNPMAADGTKISDTACAMDPAFRRMAAEYVADFARSGVDLILFDDDFCYGTRYGESIICTCPLHMKRICELLGEPIAPEELQKRAMSGGRNRHRDAWRQANREALLGFAKEMRAAVDAVDPKVRMGVCAVMSLWDIDGLDAATVSRVLAGRTRPFVRLIGAPYWAVDRKYYDCRLQNVIELERAQRSWCGEDIEVVGEGDVWPRPRSSCPAAYLELFDMAMRADGRLDGLMKYTLDYTSPVGYEAGYVDRHVRNGRIYADIERLFSPKPAAGVRIYHARDKLADVVVPKEHAGTTKMFSMFSSAAGQMMADAGIPTVYDGEGMCAAAFGEDVRSVPDSAFVRGLVIDAWAAQILTEKGVDVGVRTFGGKVRVEHEIFRSGGLKVQIPQMEACRMTLDPKAKVDSVFPVDGTNSIPASYTYENAQGGKFLVLAFDGYFNGHGKGRCYARSRQIERGIRRISGRKVPAYVYGNPDLYTMVKKAATSMSVGLWNFCADDVHEPVVELDGVYQAVEFVNCKGRLEGDRVVLSDIPPYAFAGFEVRHSCEGQGRRSADKFLWAELIAFDNARPDYGVPEYLSRMTVKPRGISLLLFDPDIVHSHAEVSEDFALPAMNCAYYGRPFNEERSRQNWTSRQLKGLVAELKSRGVEAYASVFDILPIRDDDWCKRLGIASDKPTWADDHPEVRYQKKDGASAPNLCPIKRLADGTWYEDFFAGKLVGFLKDYGFAGFHAADGYGHPRFALCDADFSDDVLDQFLAANPGLSLPSGSRQEKGDWILRQARTEWCRFYANRQSAFIGKLAKVLHAAGMSLRLNTTWTKGPQEAMIRYGEDYRLLEKAGADGFFSESSVSVLETEGWRYSDISVLDRRRADLMLLAACVRTPVIRLACVKDGLEQYNALRHAPALTESELLGLGSVYQGGQCAAPDVFWCLADGVTQDEWTWVDRTWSLLPPVARCDGVRVVWSDRAADNEVEAYCKEGYPTSSSLLARLLHAGAVLNESVRMEDVSDRDDRPLLVLNPGRFPQEERMALRRQKGRVIEFGYGADACTFGARPGDAEPGNWLVSLPERTLAHVQYSDCVQKINACSPVRPSGNDMGDLRIATYVAADGSRIIVALNDAKAYLNARMEVEDVVRDVRPLTASPSLPVFHEPLEGRRTLLPVKIPPSGVVVLSCRMQE